MVGFVKYPTNITLDKNKRTRSSPSSPSHHLTYESSTSSHDRPLSHSRRNVYKCGRHPRPIEYPWSPGTTVDTYTNMVTTKSYPNPTTDHVLTYVGDTHKLNRYHQQVLIPVQVPKDTDQNTSTGVKSQSHDQPHPDCPRDDCYEPVVTSMSPFSPTLRESIRRHCTFLHTRVCMTTSSLPVQRTTCVYGRFTTSSTDTHSWKFVSSYLL